MAAEERDFYLDVSARDRIRISQEVRDKEGPLWSDLRVIQIPEEMMKELESLLGDGNAAVTVGNDVAISDYGNKAGCSVFVKLTCNQDDESIEQTRLAAQNMSLRFAENGLAQAEQVLNKFLGKPVMPVAELTSSNVEAKPPGKVGKISLKGKKAPTFKR